MPPSFRYSRWDGTQNLDALDADEVMDALSDDLMSYGDLSAALQRLYRWGTGDMAGLEHLLRQLREQRERELSRYDLDSTVESIREQLQDVIDTERVGIDRKVDQARPEQRKLMDKLARQRRNQLDRMPDDLGGRMKALRQYEFMDEEAREKFERLLQQMLNQMFQGLKQSIQSMTREDLGLVREMVRDLNRMLEQRRQGRDTSAQFRQFMQKYGHLFPPGIETLDQLLEHLQRQMAQMNSLMQSLSPQARDELRRMMDELLQDDSLRLELARLGATMQQL